VVTRRDLSSMNSIAEASGGEVFRAEDGVPRAATLEAVFRRGEIEGEAGLRLEARDRFSLMIVLSVVLLTVSVLFRVVRWRNAY
jgi:hypothetical protein